MEYQNSADNYAIYVDSFVLALKVEGIDLPPSNESS
jgi:hypothetical protein